MSFFSMIVSKKNYYVTFAVLLFIPCYSVRG